MEDKKNFDLVVIGGGTAGLRTALYSASHGHLTALISPGVLGGTCLNTGCIPSKTMLHASRIYGQTKEVKELGIEVSGVRLNFKNLMKRVHKIISEGQEHISASIKNRNLSLFNEKASFISSNSIKAGQKIISGSKIIICTGAKPRIPSIKGLDKVKYMISDDVLDMSSLPKSIIIAGGGYIAFEFATFFSELGVKVTIIERNQRILKDLDEDISSAQRDFYLKEGISIYTNREVIELMQGKLKKVVVKDLATSKNNIIEAESILLATGRIPNSFGLNLEVAGIKMGEKGNIEINDELQTSNPDVYAIGDVTGKTPFAHAAKRESHIALQNALDKMHKKMNFDLVPWAIFTHPAISGVGINEWQAKTNGINYGILKANYSRAGRAAVIGKTEGFAKVIYNKDSKKIIGACIIGPSADELIHEFVALINCNATTTDLLEKVIHIHPTLSEVFEALKDVPIE